MISRKIIIALGGGLVLDRHKAITEETNQFR